MFRTIVLNLALSFVPTAENAPMQTGALLLPQYHPRYCDHENAQDAADHHNGRFHTSRLRIQGARRVGGAGRDDVVGRANERQMDVVGRAGGAAAGGGKRVAGMDRGPAREPHG